MSQPRRVVAGPTIQLIVSFIIPTIILFALSSDNRLGPRNAMLLALAFPVALELYRLSRRQKPSVISIASIIGIILIGVISLLGLSEQWLAVRRSALYAAAAIVVFAIVRFRPELIDKGLGRILEMQQVRLQSKKNGTEVRLAQITAKTAYIFAIFLLVIAAASYVLTLVMINAPTNSAQFNAEYAELRVVSIPAITLPFIVGLTGLLLYVVNQFEKLTGIDAEQLLKKKR